MTVLDPKHWLGETCPADATHCVRLFSGTHELYRVYIRPGHEERHDWPTFTSVSRVVVQAITDEDIEPATPETEPPVVATDWTAELCTLDTSAASFNVPDRTFALRMGREDWEDLGRPVQVDVDVRSAP